MPDPLQLKVVAQSKKTHHLNNYSINIYFHLYDYQNLATETKYSNCDKIYCFHYQTCSDQFQWRFANDNSLIFLSFLQSM